MENVETAPRVQFGDQTWLLSFMNQRTIQGHSSGDLMEFYLEWNFLFGLCMLGEFSEDPWVQTYIHMSCLASSHLVFSLI